MSAANSPKSASQVSYTSPFARLRSAVFILLLIGLWQAITQFGHVPAYILPQPYLILTTPDNWGRLLSGWRTTVIEAACGLVIGNVISIAAAFLCNRSAVAMAGIMPIAVTLKSLPLVAVIPIVTLLVGFGSGAVITVAAIVCFFPTLVNVSRGLRATPRAAADLFHLLNANDWQVLTKLRMRYALPFLFTALRITVPAVIGATMLAEYVASNAGLGYLIQDAFVGFKFVQVWQVVLIATSTTLSAYLLVMHFERKLL